jgi:2-iminobutanoate/2-iminopropanoate deaminase
MKKEIIATDKAPAAVGPYSQAVRAGDLIFSAGQLGIVPGTKEFAGPDIEAQTRQALENLKGVLEASG